MVKAKGRLAVEEVENGQENASERKKSDRKKLSELEIANEQEIRAAIYTLPGKHKAEKTSLLESYSDSFQSWHSQLRHGFNLLFYGFGSKLQLLEMFASTTLTDGTAVVVNGFIPQVNLKEVLQTVANCLWEQVRRSSKEKPPGANANSEELLKFLSMKPSTSQNPPLIYVIIHNIDGPNLRSSEAQQMLARLASCDVIHLVASADYVHSALLWDSRMANVEFNWWYHYTPTYASYFSEMAFVPSLLHTRGSESNARSAAVVMKSLTPNARDVFLILGGFQLAHPEESGLPFHRWYTLCREKFLVNSELTLRAHLTEFKDHEIVKSRRGSDGQDYLYIPHSEESLVNLISDIRGA